MKSPLVDDAQRAVARQIGTGGPAYVPYVGRIKPEQGCPCSACQELAAIIGAKENPQ